jgi:lysophospholipase L1-like esterase
MLIFGSLVLCFIVIEIGYRIFDPFPYFSSSEINDTEHGNLAMYDPILGWKGVPWGKGELITKNNKVSLSHNKEGFRDLEHNSLKERKPAIAFLGDSFTWGYEVEFNDMFVNRLRNKLTNYEIFNLSFRGYGTDQEFLTFQNWGYSGPLKWVILIFCENDIIENNSLNAYEKPKPKYEIVNNQLELVGIPVPRTDSWGKNIYEEKRHPSWKESLAKVVFFSHFLHETYYRYKRLKLRFSKNYDLKANWPSTLKKSHPERWDLTLTYRILQELKHHVEERGAELVVFFIPPKRVVEKLDDASPSHIKADIEICTELGIKNHDLTPYFKKTFLRTYYRQGAHWNPRGHQVAAEAIYHYLITDVFP